MAYILIAAGFALLLVGGDVLVRGAVGIARRAGLPPLVIGLTLVGFGTSTPELLTSVNAALAGSPGIAVGNVVGSNVANILLILGVAAMVGPIAVFRTEFRRDAATLVLATLLASGLMATGALGRGAGALLLAGLCAFLVVTLRSGGGVAEADEEPEGAPSGAARSWLAFAGGLAGVVVGADLLVSGATELARGLGVSDAVIGLTIVAIGTSLPELVTSVVAARRGQAGVALGNVLGSNVFNLLGILGATALIAPIPVPREILSFDIWVMGAATAALLAVAVTGWRVSRVEGAALLLAYAAYLGWLGATA